MNCPFCKNPAIWIENSSVYGRNFGKSYMIWLCKPCDAYVGCHNNTKKPLGTIADRATRQARKNTHAILDPLWRNGTYGRKEIYAKLKEHFGREIHVGESSIEQCKEISDFITKNL